MALTSMHHHLAILTPDCLLPGLLSLMLQMMQLQPRQTCRQQESKEKGESLCNRRLTFKPLTWIMILLVLAFLQLYCSHSLSLSLLPDFVDA